MNTTDRRQEMRTFIAEIDWSSYDYTRAASADMSFPDFTEAQLATNPPWCGKHYNETSSWNCVHVPDLNQIQSGAERRLMALYGIPVQWPSRSESEDELYDLLCDLDAAQAKGGEVWSEEMDRHGLLNDEHYAWLRGRSLGVPDGLQDYEAATRAITLISRNPELLNELGFYDQAHFDYFKKSVSRAKAAAWTKHAALLKETFQALDERFERNKAALLNELAPYQGVSMEDWAAANAQLAQAKPLETVLQVLGIERPQWDQINAEWMARMSRDTTATVATVYGQAFTGAAQGKFAAAARNVSKSMMSGQGRDVTGEAPVSFEDWIKIQAHMNAALAQGIDPNALLADYRLKAADWGIAGGYWAMKMNSNPMEYLEQYQTLSAKYATAFSRPKAGSDIDF